MVVGVGEPVLQRQLALEQIDLLGEGRVGDRVRCVWRAPGGAVFLKLRPVGLALVEGSGEGQVQLLLQSVAERGGNVSGNDAVVCSAGAQSSEVVSKAATKKGKCDLSSCV